MSARLVMAKTDKDKPLILFVDDEQRVLNSMRVMFRREFDLRLTTRPHEALEIIGKESIDVIVADHRMPEMTGVDVLYRVKLESPRTVRILLTGYADLDAIEGSINKGEVFRFLTKPCAPQELRDTVRQAAEISRQQAITASVEAEVAAEAAAAARKPSPPQAPGQPGPMLAPPLKRVPAMAKTPPRPAPPPGPAVAPKVGPPLTKPRPPAISGDETLPDILAALEAESAAKPRRAEREVTATPPAMQVPLAKVKAPTAEPSPPGNNQSATAGPASIPDIGPDEMTETIVMEGDGFEIVSSTGGEEKPARKPSTTKRGAIGVLVFSNDEELLKTVKAAGADEFLVVHATNIVRVTKLLTGIRPGIMVTDISEDPAVIERLVSTLKQHLPELVTIVVGEHRDTVGLVNLINFGQVFRFLRKPLAPGPCQVSIRAAARKHLMLRKHPDLIKRHVVNAAPETHEDSVTGKFGGVIDRLRNVRKRWVASS